MDCVDCDKCRLWGKLQTHGIGTALKILFFNLPKKINYSFDNKAAFQLTRFFKNNNSYFLLIIFFRNDFVALFQSFGRFASNIFEVDEFRREILNKKK